VNVNYDYSKLVVCIHYWRRSHPRTHTVPSVDSPGPFEQVAVDCIGPWKIKIVRGDPVKVFALTCTCAGSNSTEFARLDDKTSEHATIKFENTWLCRCPRPGECVHDQGGEFTGAAFQAMLATNDIRSVPFTVKNSMGKSVAERMHRVVPGAAVFGRDMLINIPVSVDWEMIGQRRRARMTCNNEQENAKRRFKDFQVGDMAHLKNDSRRKLAQKNLGPFGIDQVHANGTTTLELDGGAFERVNIMRIDPGPDK